MLLKLPPGGGGEVLNKCLYQEARPEVRPVTLLYTIFHEKGTPLVYLLLKNGTGINHKNRTFSRLYKAIKFISWPFWTLSQTQMTDFPTLLYTSTSEIPTLSYS